jgi:subtilisin family serine protease
MAPGVKIYSTLPGNNRFGFEQGTSMSAPVVSGIAALIRSYFPQLSAKQVKYAIINSAMPVTDSLVEVKDPGTNKAANLADLCAAAGIVNAYAAIKLASEMKPETPYAGSGTQANPNKN